jgi:hypothetical protein
MKDISLEELSKRYPDVKKDVDEVTFETAPKPPSPPDGGKSKPLLRVVRDIILGLTVTFFGFWMIYLFPWLIP